MSQFKAFAELELPKGVSKKIVNHEAQTIRYEFLKSNSFMVLGISLTMSLVMLFGAFASLWDGNPEARWQVFFIMFALAVPPFIVFVVWKNIRHYCLLDFKNMKIQTGIATFRKERIVLSEDLNNIEFIILHSEKISGRASYIAFNHRAAFMNKAGERFYFTKLYNEKFYKEAFDYLKEISEILKIDSFSDKFIKNTIIQYLQMFPKYSYLKLSIETRFEEVLEPLLDEMNLEHINLLLDAANNHSEFSNRKQIRKSILKIVDEKFNDRIEKEKYPNIFGKNEK